jgi:glycosyltransferase involved in cell wall biosynthesis
MAERKRINILYNYNSNWIAGVYYVRNIITALNYLSDTEKPEIVLYYTKIADTDAITDVGYPYMEFILSDISNIHGLLIRIINKLMFVFRGTFHFIKTPFKFKVNNLYLVAINYDIKNIRQAVVWIPDFQEKYLPEFFKIRELKYRDVYNKAVVRSGVEIVFSSANAMADFDKYYPDNRNIKHVLRFVSFIDLKKLSEISAVELLQKYSVRQPYFIVSNQFWAHKNHGVVLEAIRIAKTTQPDISVVFTGRENDYRNPNYIADLKDFIARNNLSENVRLLGLVERYDQLALMRNSVAVIQPSLFEGWSTVVEDCKTIGKHIILSNLPVHLEQISENVTFFDPHNAQQLAAIMTSPIHSMNFTEQQLTEKQSERAINFANDFISIFKQ